MEGIGGTSNSLPKWQIALVVGAPILLGVGYMYFRNRDNLKKKPSKSKERILAASENHGDKSITESSKVIEIFEKTLLEQANAFKKEGNRCFNIGKFDEAISHYNMAIDTCPKENVDELATFYQNRAAAYEKLNKFSAVKADCTLALELRPKYIKALMRRARVAELSNDFETALEDLTVTYFLENFSNQNTIDEAEKVLQKLNQKNVQEYILTKKPAMPSKYYINNYLSSFCNDPILKDSKNPSIDDSTPYNRALLALKNQEYDNIIALCTEELENLSPDDDSLHKLKVILLRSTFYVISQHDEAFAGLNIVINNEKSTPEMKINALIKRASLYTQFDNFDKSLENFAEAEKIDPQCGDIYQHRGQLFFGLENFIEARNDFQKSIELNPGFGPLFAHKCYVDYHYAQLMSDMNLLNDAISNFEEAFENFPDCIECYSLYGQALILNKEFEKAEMYFIEGLKKDPNNVAIYLYRGLACMKGKNDFDRAKEMIEKALEFDDKFEMAYNILGTIEAQRGNLKEAISYFDKSIPLARTLHELTQTFNMRDLTKSQLMVSKRLGTGFEHHTKF